MKERPEQGHNVKPEVMQTQVTRRELFKRAGKITGEVLVAGTLVGFLGRELVQEVQEDIEFNRQDHYKGIPLTEYVKGSFSMVVGNYSGHEKTYSSLDPVNEPRKRFNSSSIERVNGYDVSGEIYVQNPGIIRGTNPTTLEENTPWIVLNSKVLIPNNNWWEDFYSTKSVPRLLYVYREELDDNQDQEQQFEFVPLVMKPDGTHADANTGDAVEYLGAVSRPFQGPIRLNL